MGNCSQGPLVFLHQVSGLDSQRGMHVCTYLCVGRRGVKRWPQEGQLREGNRFSAGGTTVDCPPALSPMNIYALSQGCAGH